MHVRKSTPDMNSQHECVKMKMTDLQQSTNSLRTLILDHTSDTKKWQSDLLYTIRASKLHEPGYESVPQPPDPLKSYQGSTASDFRGIILQMLRYREMDHRAEQVKEAHRSTFEWIWQEPEDEHHRWQNFSNFLRDDTGLFWITGKPGAGKSTLMKYLSQDPRTKQLLGSPSIIDTSDSELVCAEFFFWNSGTPMQMSREALLRTLLHESLKNCEEQFAIIFPDLWEAYNLLRANPPDDWMWSELVEAFRRLLKTPGKRFFFLIDGLDEFSNNNSDLVELADFLKSIAQLDNVKICVSSRPWVVFEDAFKSTPSLKIEELTFKDIKSYVEDRFSQNPGYKNLTIDEPAYISVLAQNITDKSNGVFLWVTLVVNSLLFGITEGDSVEDLESKLTAFPADLEDFFSKMLRGGDPDHITQACQIYRKFQCWHNYHADLYSTHDFTLMQMYMADLQGVEDVLQAPLRPFTLEEEAPKLERMKRRLNSRCKGLLESQETGSSNDPFISWIHRTAADYVKEQETWTWIVQNSGDTFDPAFHVCISVCHIAKRDPMLHFERSCVDSLRKAIEFANDSIVTSNGATATSLVAVLDSLDDSIRHCLRNHGHKIARCPSDGAFSLDFLNVAVHENLTWYIHEKMRQNKLKDVPKSASPLLLCAIRHCTSGRHVLKPKDVNMVKILLEAGKTRDFKRAMIYVNSRVKDSTFGDSDCWREIQELFIQYEKKSKKRQSGRASKSTSFRNILAVLNRKNKGGE